MTEENLTTKPNIQFEELFKLDIRVCEIINVEKVEKSIDKYFIFGCNINICIKNFCKYLEKLKIFNAFLNNILLLFAKYFLNFLYNIVLFCKCILICHYLKVFLKVTNIP